VAAPGVGHLLPMVPTAWAARFTGHEVLFATTGPSLTMAVNSGMPAIDVSDGSATDVYFQLVRALPEGDGHFDCHTPNVWQRVVSGLLGQGMESEEYRQAIAAVAKMNDHMVDSTVRVARAWRADVLVYTPMVVAGLLAATAVGIPAVLHGLGLPYPTFVAALEVMTDAQERHGLGGTPVGPMGSIDLCPESVRPTGTEPGWPMRYVPHNGGAVLPDWLFTPPDYPRVCVTLGSVLPVIGGGGVLGCTIDALAAINVEVVVAVVNLHLSAYRLPPVNFRVVPWVPLSALLPSCAAIIHHGGAGTTFTAFACGIPQLVVPTHLPDHSIYASAVVRRGAGLAVPAHRADVESVRAAVDQVLTDRALCTAATEVQDEIAAMPRPNEAVQHLSQLVPRGTRSRNS
jgi:hypothetical protein